MEALLDPGSLMAAGRYAAALGRLWGMYQPLEAELRWAPAARPAELRKAGWLAADLAELGVGASQRAALPRCQALPPLDTDLQVLGCRYVLEGATMGGAVLVRQLRSAAPRLPVRFFLSYGVRRGPRWQAVRGELCAAVRDDKDLAALVGGAQATFETFASWLAPWRAEEPREPAV